jgi:hypothetical protein
MEPAIGAARSLPTIQEGPASRLSILIRQTVANSLLIPGAVAARINSSNAGFRDALDACTMERRPDQANASGNVHRCAHDNHSVDGKPRLQER